MSQAAPIKHALVTGPLGIVGMNVVEELVLRPEWKILAVGRRENPPLSGVSYVCADLLDGAATKSILGGNAARCTHLFFAAFMAHKDPYEECRLNVALLRNTLDALYAAGAPLKRVVICEGAKAYGALVGPMRTPVKETDPRVPGPLYYYALEDLLWSEGAAHGFTTTILRPDCIAGLGLGKYTNLVHAVALWATICKAEGMPLHYPGGRQAFENLFQITDARLLARGLIWAAEAATMRDEIYNITNGDLFRWSLCWPRIAAYFGMEVGQVLNVDLQLYMRDKGRIWETLTRQHGLVVPFDALYDWQHQGILKLPMEIHSSTIRIRKAGFHECLDSEDRLFELFDEMRARKWIP
jgi:nucleoside-diphosphate-sugar epimerase